jgi:heat-inducible transcriptional repressor
MREERALYDQLLHNVILLGSAAMVTSSEHEKEESEVYLGGTSRVIRRLEDSDIDKLISLLQTFEEKKCLVKIITECLKAGRAVPTVTVGLEEHIPGMRNWSLITSPYSYDQYTTGGLAVLGPSRMEYERAIGLVDCVAGLFGEILRGNMSLDAE